MWGSLVLQAEPLRIQGSKDPGTYQSEVLFFSVTRSRTGCLGWLIYVCLWGRVVVLVQDRGTLSASEHQHMGPESWVQHPGGLGCPFISAPAVSTHLGYLPKTGPPGETGPSVRPASQDVTLFAPQGRRWGWGGWGGDQRPRQRGGMSKVKEGGEKKAAGP